MDVSEITTVQYSCGMADVSCDYNLYLISFQK